MKPALLHETYSQPLTGALKKAMLQFERRMPGFASDVGLLHGVETRTSAPVSDEVLAVPHMQLCSKYSSDLAYVMMPPGST